MVLLDLITLRVSRARVEGDLESEVAESPQVRPAALGVEAFQVLLKAQGVVTISGGISSRRVLGEQVSELCARLFINKQI
jgi:hypothetical protein